MFFAGSDVYDLETHIRATKKAMQLCEDFASEPVAPNASPAQPAEEQASDGFMTAEEEWDAQHQAGSWHEHQPNVFTPDPVEQEMPPSNDGNAKSTKQATNITPAATLPSSVDAKHVIKAISGGQGSQHRLIWEDGTADWWQSSLHTQGFKLESSDYVGQQVSIQINPATSKHKKRKVAILGIVVSVGSSLLEVCVADGTKMKIDVNTNSAGEQDVEWLIDFQETRWLNDSHVQWDTCDELVQGARKEWLKNNKELFPLEDEAEAIVKALLTMLDPAVELDAAVIKSVQARQFRKVPAQQGSLLKDALDVLESLRV